MRRYHDRHDAGQALAGLLEPYAGNPEVTVLALPRGGVPVGAEVARRLGAPLDVMVVRKLGVPGHEELAMGALASGGVRVINRDVVEELGIPERAIEAVVAREAVELQRRERAYRGDRPPAEEADEIVCGQTPEPFRAVGLWYQDFSQTTDDEVHAELGGAR